MLGGAPVRRPIMIRPVRRRPEADSRGVPRGESPLKVLNERQGDGAPPPAPSTETAVGHADVVEDLCHLGGRGGVVVGGDTRAGVRMCPPGPTSTEPRAVGREFAAGGVWQLACGVEGGQCAAGRCDHAVVPLRGGSSELSGAGDGGLCCQLPVTGSSR